MKYPDKRTITWYDDETDAWVGSAGYLLSTPTRDAAEELLEALVELRKWMGPCGLDYEIDAAMQAADKAIAKAKG